MSHNPSAMTPVRKFAKEMIRHPFLWLVPTVLFTCGAIAYTVWGPQTWQASQAFFLREELSGDNVRPGRFESIDAMKTAQETIHEIARNPVVIKDALKKIGPPEDHKEGVWPEPKEIEAVRDTVKVIAPNGAEFGKTEVLHLNVEASTRDYALEFAGELMSSIEERLRSIRLQKSKGIEAELSQARDLAKQEVEAVKDQVQAIESLVGADLGELRSLNQPTAGDGSLGRSLSAVTQELRKAVHEFEIARQQHEHLSALKNDPNGIVATPTVVLASHPGLSRLKDGLVDAQIVTSQTRGLYKAGHPMTLAAVAIERDIQQQVRNEVTTALKGAEVELKISRQQVESLRAAEADMSSRLRLLVDQRVPYSEALDKLQRKKGVLASIEKDLTEVQANLRSSEVSSLIARIDGPQSGPEPQGPGKRAVVLGGAAFGFATGIGFLMFVTAPVPSRRRTGQSRDLHLEIRDEQVVVKHPTHPADGADDQEFDGDLGSAEHLIAEVEHLRKELEWIRESALASTEEARASDPQGQATREPICNLRIDSRQRNAIGMEFGAIIS